METQMSDSYIVIYLKNTLTLNFGGFLPHSSMQISLLQLYDSLTSSPEDLEVIFIWISQKM